MTVLLEMHTNFLLLGSFVDYPTSPKTTPSRWAQLYRLRAGTQNLGTEHSAEIGAEGSGQTRRSGGNCKLNSILDFA